AGPGAVRPPSACKRVASITAVVSDVCVEDVFHHCAHQSPVFRTAMRAMMQVGASMYVLSRYRAPAAREGRSPSLRQCFHAGGLGGVELVAHAQEIAHQRELLVAERLEHRRGAIRERLVD